MGKLTAVVCGRALSVYQEQQLFMGWLAPSPPWSATGRNDGAHCGAGPPCTFRYARTLLLMCDLVNEVCVPPKKIVNNLWGSGSFGGSLPSRGLNHPSGD